MNYKQLQSGDIVLLFTIFKDGAIDLPLVIDYVDSPQHCVTHNHISAKQFIEFCGADIAKVEDAPINLPFLNANGWIEEYRVYSFDDGSCLSFSRHSQETYSTYEFRIINKYWKKRFEGEIATIRGLQHVLRDCGMESIADNLSLPELSKLE